VPDIAIAQGLFDLRPIAEQARRLTGSRLGPTAQPHVFLEATGQG